MRDEYVKRLNGIYHNNLKKGDIEYIKGTAQFVEDKIIDVEGVKYTAEHIMIASGSKPSKLKFPGAEYCMTSDDVFSLETLPESLIVIGAGYIVVEMAQIFNGFGVKVTVITIDDVLPNMDHEITEALKATMTQKGIDIRIQT